MYPISPYTSNRLFVVNLDNTGQRRFQHRRAKPVLEPMSSRRTEKADLGGRRRKRGAGRVCGLAEFLELLLQVLDAIFVLVVVAHFLLVQRRHVLVLAPQAIKLQIGVLDPIREAQLLAVVLALQRRDAATVGFGQVRELLVVHVGDIFRQELGERSACRELCEKQGHDCDQDGDEERDFAVTDVFRLRLSACKQWREYRQTNWLVLTEKSNPQMAEQRKRAKSS